MGYETIDVFYVTRSKGGRLKSFKSARSALKDPSSKGGMWLIFDDAYGRVKCRKLSSSNIRRAADFEIGYVQRGRGRRRRKK